MNRRDEILNAAQAAASVGVETPDVITLAMPVLVADFEEAYTSYSPSSDSIPQQDAEATEEGLRQALQTLSMILEPSGITLL